MIHDSDSIWLLISVVWVAVLLTALLLGSLLAIFARTGGRFFCLPPQASGAARRRWRPRFIADFCPGPEAVRWLVELGLKVKTGSEGKHT